tara:strand:+ start:135 stop:437 length:303 start_codon:yes stop_codon:yes gene_type:complete
VCEVNRLGDIIRGAALAVQKDTKNYNSDCFLAADRAVYDIEGSIQSYIDIFDYISKGGANETSRLKKYGINFLLPVQWWNTFVIDLSDVMYACQFKTFLK